jgi:hypothetical protein
MTSWPPGVARRLPGERLDLDRAADRARAIGRLLEEGDRDDLAWLAATVGVAAIADWFDRHGGRLLSRRSRAFWAATLGRPRPPARPIAEALWPLA